MRALNGAEIPAETLRLGNLAPRLLVVAGGATGLGLAGSLALAALTEGGTVRLLQTYLVSFCFFLTLSLGALFFVLLQHVTRAGWSVTVRRLAEAMAMNLGLLAALAVPVVLGMHRLYHWSHAEAMASDPLLADKAGYLNPAFFVIRLVLYFAVWIAMAVMLFRASTAQDGSREEALSLRMERLSAPGMVLFAVTINLAAFDLLMSLDPHWFSTIFGVYLFAASVVGFFAALPPLILWLQGRGRLAEAVTIEHYHDLGKMLFVFVVFWAYIAFSQYMLIWYANLPEETGWYVKRQSGDWLWVSIALILGHFVVPFFALISRIPKRRPKLLAVAAGWMLVMHWLDLYWLAGPELGSGVALGALDALCFLTLLGLYTGGLVLLLRRHSLIPEGDPRLDEALAFENA